jgi:hypothetical protein
LSQGAQLALDELFAERSYTIYKHFTIKVIKLVLHDTSQISLNPLIMVLKILIIPLYTDAGWTSNLLMNGG